MEHKQNENMSLQTSGESNAALIRWRVEQPSHDICNCRRVLSRILTHIAWRLH